MSRYNDKIVKYKKPASPVLPCISGVLFLVLIALLKTVDVANVGVAGTSIGLSSINTAFAKLTGVNEIWKKITTVMGVFLILAVAAFALLGLVQLIKRKSLLKVDREILSLGGLYVVTAVMYVLFEKVIINYRPILMDGATEPEASFPSSHTMLACVVMGSTLVLVDRYVKNKNLATLLKVLCVIVLLVTVVGRAISGVHWLTDIIGGVLLSITLVGFFRVAAGR